MQTPVWLAVDLGTTHTVAVVGRDGQEPRSLLFDGSPLLPSGVFLDTGGDLHTGRDAQRLAAAEPERFESHPKRRIDEGTVLLGDREVPVEELLATGLRRIADEAAASGLRPTETVLTYPADWGPVRRAVLERAAQVAALPRVRLLPEPIAAATYCAEVLGQEIPVGGAVAIFDFGGGTFDAAVVRRAEDGRLRTLAVGGLDDLGGLDVDMTLAAHLGRIVAGRDLELWRRLSEPETTADLRDRLAFWGEVRAAKEMLSRTSTAPVALPGHNPMGLHLTRDELTSLADPLVARAVDETRRTLERSGVEPAELTALLLVGGSSRMPLVATRLHARFGIAPSVPEQPELPVAFGALRHALAEPDLPAVTTPTPSPPQTPASPVTYTPYLTATSPDSAPSPPVPPVSPVTYTPYLTTTSSDSAPSPPAPPVTYTPYLTTTSPDSAPSPNLEQSAPPPRQRTPLPSYPGPLPTADPPRRRWVAFSVASSILMVIVITIVVAVNQFGGGDATKGETGEPLVLAYTQQLSADDTSAVAAAEGKAILAEVVDGSTVVSAVTPEGETLWTQTYELEPNELYLTVVEDLLIIDAYDLVTDDDEDIRAVAALDDGALLWQKPWTLNEHNDVAYYGTDVVFERRDGFEDNAVARVDLATGEEVWSKPGPDDVFILDEPRVRAETVWGVEEGTGAIPPDFYSLYDNLAAGDRIVDLDPHEGTAVVRDAATGDGITDGELPIDDEAWTVYDDLVVARASDEASPDRDTLVAHALSDLGKAWEVPLDPGFGIEHVKPCGPDLVCAALGDSSADDQHKTVAFDTETGDQVWELPVDWYLHDQWYTGPSGLVFGDQVFDTVDSFQNLDFEGDVIVEGQRFSSAMAVRDNRVVIEDRDSGGRNISILDLGTDGRSAPAGTGGHAPRHVSLLGELMVVLTGDWKAQVYIVPDIT